MITFVPEELKLNRFRQVRCPRPAELAKLHGYRLPSGEMFSGDEHEDNDLRKTEQMQAALDKVRETVAQMPKQE